MATKEEIISGVELLIQESKRLTGDLRPEQLEHAVDLDGWKGKEALAHVAAVGTLVPQMAGGFASASGDAMASINIDQLNAALVAQRASKTAQELTAEIETSYKAVIEFVRGAPDDVLATKATAGGYVDVPVSDLLIRMVVMHGMAHLYSVYSSVFTAKL